MHSIQGKDLSVYPTSLLECRIFAHAISRVSVFEGKVYQFNSNGVVYWYSVVECSRCGPVRYKKIDPKTLRSIYYHYDYSQEYTDILEIPREDVRDELSKRYSKRIKKQGV